MANCSPGQTGASTDWPMPGLPLFATSDWSPLPIPEDAGNTSAASLFVGRQVLASATSCVGDKQRTSRAAILPPYTVNDYDYAVHLREVPRQDRSIHSVSPVCVPRVSPYGSTLVGTPGPKLRVWDLVNDCDRAHKRGTKFFQGLAFTADGRYLATVSNDETVRLWDAHLEEKTTFTWQRQAPEHRLRSTAWPRPAATAGQIVIWDVEGRSRVDRPTAR